MSIDTVDCRKCVRVCVPTIQMHGKSVESLCQPIRSNLFIAHSKRWLLNRCVQHCGELPTRFHSQLLWRTILNNFTILHYDDAVVVE